MTDEVDNGPPPVLEATSVTVRFGGLTALDGVNLKVLPQSIVGLVGPNGAGKSTLFAVLSGLLTPDSGHVLTDGVDITGLSPQARARRGLARTFQHPQLFTDLTVREHLVLADRLHHARNRLWTDLVSARGFRRSDQKENVRVDDLIEALGLTSSAHRQAVGLPLGICRLIEVGRALAASPKVLLLDEASSGLDEQETAELARVLTQMTEDRAISVVLVEHDVDLVFGLSNYVYVLDFGVLIAEGTPAQTRANPTVRAAYLGDEVLDVDEVRG